MHLHDNHGKAGGGATLECGVWSMTVDYVKRDSA